eukprot:gene62908-86050_t
MAWARFAAMPFAGAAQPRKPHRREQGMKASACRNVDDFRELARRRLPWPVFHYIDGAADDELTKTRNTAAFGTCDLVPSVLAGVETIDMSVTVMGKKVAMPLFLSPTALQRLFHWRGERAVGAAAMKFDTWFGISSLATVSIEEIGRTVTVMGKKVAMPLFLSPTA